MERERMDREFKIVLALFAMLCGVAAFLLIFLAQVPFPSREFFLSFIPFAALLGPYVFFGSRAFVTFLQDVVYLSFRRKLLFPVYLLSIYSIFAWIASNFAWILFFKLAAWLWVPTLIFSFEPLEKSRLTWKEWAVVLILWAPVEFGVLSGFDIGIVESLAVPALPFAACALGMYLFSCLRHLRGIGYTFSLKKSDLVYAFGTLLVLGLVLVRASESLGFVSFSIEKISFIEIVKLVFGVYFLVALPEELLFRGILQNLLTQGVRALRCSRVAGLVLASVIFGLAHWNNASPTDWRYVSLAAMAGLAYGFVYLKTGKVSASAIVHCGVNVLWAIFFSGTQG